MESEIGAKQFKEPKASDGRASGGIQVHEVAQGAVAVPGEAGSMLRKAGLGACIVKTVMIQPLLTPRVGLNTGEQPPGRGGKKTAGWQRAAG